MKRVVIATAIAVALSAQAMAGDIPTSDVLPPPPSSNHSTAVTSPGTPDVNLSLAAIESTESELLDTFLLSIVSLLVL